jgi:hypothetical protein
MSSCKHGAVKSGRDAFRTLGDCKSTRPVPLATYRRSVARGTRPSTGRSSPSQQTTPPREPRRGPIQPTSRPHHCRLKRSACQSPEQARMIGRQGPPVPLPTNPWRRIVYKKLMVDYSAVTVW